MVKYLTDHYYLGATRYKTRTFLRVKLVNARESRAVAPNLYETRRKRGVIFGIWRQQRKNDIHI
jgi:hypothetical protein